MSSFSHSHCSSSVSFSPSYRYMLGLSIVPALLQFIGFFFLPESPRWLLQKGRSQEARSVLSRIRGERSVDEEYDAIRASVEEEEKEAGGGDTFLKIRKKKKHRMKERRKNSEPTYDRNKTT